MGNVTRPGNGEVTLDAHNAASTVDTIGAQTLGDGTSGGYGSSRAAEFPKSIGRHQVESVIGRGGMGIVFAAHDPELDRRIAIKLVYRMPYDGADVTQARSRMKREAQAMARLNHPNVITVYDVGEQDERLYIAMELVKGRSLRRWLDGDPAPSWQQVLDSFEQAGAGLAAAHRAGLVHRDFKPDNAMIGDDDGVVRVLDFGLAQPTDEQQQTRPLEAVDIFEPTVTRTGALVGTPAYMAPEQLDGRAADARSDQFSFCVALWEGLYGARPFGGDDLAALVFSVTSGKIRMPSHGRGVPPWLRRVVMRGLATNPAQRWPSMDALLFALRKGRGRSRRWLVGAMGAAVAFSLGGTAWTYWRSEGVACNGSQEALSGAWDDASREAVGAALRAGKGVYAQRAAERAVARLDDYAKRWVDVHREACEATHVRHEQSGDALDRKMACLHQHRARLSALVQELAKADDALVQRAVTEVTRLPVPERCGDLQALERTHPIPDDPDAAERVAHAREVMAEVHALEAAARLDEAKTHVDELVVVAEEIGYEPLLAEVLARQATLLQRLGKHEDSEQVFLRAHNIALAVGHDQVAYDCASGLLYVLGTYLGKDKEAQVWVDAARALARRAELGASAMGTIDINESAIHLRLGHYDRALELAQRGREALENAYGEEDPRLLEAYASEAMARARRGDLDEAGRLFERTVEIAVHDGPDHPEVARALVNLAVVQNMRQDYESARASLERALPIFEAAYGSQHHFVATVLNNLGGLHHDIGDYEPARAAHQRALEIRREVFGEEHESIAQSLHNLGNALAGLGQHLEAIEHYERAVTVREKTLRTDHPVIAQTLGNQANSLVELGRAEEALPLLDRALEISEKAHGPEHPQVAFPLTSKGEALLALGRWADAIAPLDRALRLREGASDIDPRLLGATRLGLSKASWNAGGDKRHATELARQARRNFIGATGTKHESLEQIDAWLAEIDAD